MRELDNKEILQVSGGAFFLAPAVFKGAVWAVATVGGTAAAHFAYEFVSDS